MSESKAEPERHGKVKVSFYYARDSNQQVIDYQQTNGMKTLTEAYIGLIQKGLSTNIEALDFQKCKKRSEIPAHYGKFVRCLVDGRVITEEQCRACQQYSIIKVPLRKYEKIEAQFREKKDLLDDLFTKINNAETQLSENTIEGLQKQVSYFMAYTSELKETIDVSETEAHDCRK